MKYLLAAIVLVSAAPAVAQTAPAQAPQGHGQQQGQHQQHGQHQSGQHPEQGGCCADRNNNGRMDCCEGMAQGDRRGCCQERPAQAPVQPQPHQGH